MFGESIVIYLYIHRFFLKLRSGWFPARPDKMSGFIVDTPLLNHADIVPTNSNMSHDSRWLLHHQPVTVSNEIGNMIINHWKLGSPDVLTILLEA